MENPTTVLCVDDVPSITALYAKLIDKEPDMRCVGTLADASALDEAVRRTGADVVLLDLTMPAGKDPLTALRELLGASPDVRVLVFSGHDDLDAQSAALDAGAWGLVSKHGEPSEVLAAIRKVARGEVVLPP